MERLEPDKAAYQEELATFIRTTVANYPRTDAATKIKLTSQANQQFTRQYGVQVNLLMTKLFGAERTKFGFENEPEFKHFALKIYGKVYEFGPHEGQNVRKTMFLDWCADYLAFEFATATASNSSRSNNNDNPTRNIVEHVKSQPVTTYTMKFEWELDDWAKDYCEKTGEYHPIKNNCLHFVKAALAFLDPSPNSGSELQQWLSKYEQQLKPPIQLPEEEHQQQQSDNSELPVTHTCTEAVDSPLAVSVSSMDDEDEDDQQEKEIECVDLISDEEPHKLCEL